MTTPLAYHLKQALTALKTAEKRNNEGVQECSSSSKGRAKTNAACELGQVGENMDLLMKELHKEEYLHLYTVSQAQAFMDIKKSHLKECGNLRGVRIVQSSPKVEAEIRRTIMNGDLHEYYLLDKLPLQRNQLNGPNGNQGVGGLVAGNEFVNEAADDGNQVASQEAALGNSGVNGAADDGNQLENGGLLLLWRMGATLLNRGL